MTGNTQFSSVSKTRKRRSRLVLATTLLASVSAIATPGAEAVSAAAAQPPTFSDVTPLVVMKVNGVRNAIVTYPDPVATDASGSALPVTCSPPSGSTFPLGDTDVSCLATDAQGAEALVSFVVRVVDDVPPPAATDVVVRGSKASVSLTWRLPSSPDLAGTEIVRYPGALVVFHSAGTSFVDTDIQAGARYLYRVASYDWADNHSPAVDVHTIAVNAKLIEPQDWAQLTQPPLLAWARVPGAGYYNVQLWATVPGGLKKVLSIWPSSNHLQLSSKWVFGGRSYGLTQGRYRWYVWPGLGRLVDAHYGDLIGSHVFVIVR
jgi:hypothetical protein